MTNTKLVKLTVEPVSDVMSRKLSSRKPRAGTKRAGVSAIQAPPRKQRAAADQAAQQLQAALKDAEDFADTAIPAEHSSTDSTGLP